MNPKFKKPLLSQYARILKDLTHLKRPPFSIPPKYAPVAPPLFPGPSPSPSNNLRHKEKPADTGGGISN